jgi:hypothetical protein
MLFGAVRYSWIVVVLACGGGPSTPSSPTPPAPSSPPSAPPPASPSPAPNGSLTAIVNGTAFSATQASAIYANGQLGVAGGNAAGTSVGFSVIGPSDCTGTYTAGQIANGAYSEGDKGWVTFSGNGSFVITVCTNDRVVGTFSFVAEPNAPTGATGTVTVTNGAFDVPRTNQQ